MNILQKCACTKCNLIYDEKFLKSLLKILKPSTLTATTNGTTNSNRFAIFVVVIFGTVDHRVPYKAYGADLYIHPCVRLLSEYLSCHEWSLWDHRVLLKNLKAIFVKGG